jgi:hypothetical protein
LVYSTGIIASELARYIENVKLQMSVVVERECG